jgi:hypothetical protein
MMWDGVVYGFYQKSRPPDHAAAATLRAVGGEL